MPQKTSITRLRTSEYGAFSSIGEAASQAGIAPSTLREQLQRISDRVTQALAISEPILFRDGRFRVVDVAGMLRISARLEIEVCPKYLSANDATWREDFFVIAAIARFGRILPREALRASTAQSTISDLLAQAMTNLFEQNERRPLRTYRRQVWSGFELDGEIDPESWAFPESEGFQQSGILLDRKNRFNQTIHSAMEALLPEVRNGDLRRRLFAQHGALSPQNEAGRTRSRNERLPARHRRWQDLYDLSKQILEGFGIRYHAHFAAQLPGYVLKTAETWESLLTVAARAGLPEWTVSKIPHTLGGRAHLADAFGTQKSIQVTPDLTIQDLDGKLCIVDAKYKSRASSDPAGKDRLSIQPSDLYESLAFMNATATPRILLIYPLPASIAPQARTGNAIVFERCVVSGQEVIGAAIDVRGISQNNGFRMFADGLAALIQSCAD